MVEILSKYWQRFLLVGVGTTIVLALISVIGGTLLGTLVALGRMSKFKPLRAIITAYVEVVRGTPALVQLTIGYVLIPNLFPSVNNLAPTTMGFICVAIALILNSGAYVAEIVRGGLESVDDGQLEAGASLGLTRTQVMLFIILPQGFRRALPALFNEFIALIKETSIVGTIGVVDITKVAERIIARTYEPFTPYLVTAIIYLVIVIVLTQLLKLLEKKLAKGDKNG